MYGRRGVRGSGRRRYRGGRGSGRYRGEEEMEEMGDDGNQEIDKSKQELMEEWEDVAKHMDLDMETCFPIRIAVWSPSCNVFNILSLVLDMFKLSLGIWMI